MDTLEFATCRLIDSVWTLAFRRVEGGVEIVAHSRTLPRGYEEEHKLPRFTIVEKETDDSKRTAVAVKLAPYKPFRFWADNDSAVETLAVMNPGDVFSYQCYDRDLDL